MRRFLFAVAVHDLNFSCHSLATASKLFSAAWWAVQLATFLTMPGSVFSPGSLRALSQQSRASARLVRGIGAKARILLASKAVV